MSPYVVDSVTEYVWTGAELEQGAPREGCTAFALRALDYWQLQECLAEPDAVGQIRRTLELGIVSVDGDTEAAKLFARRPHARLAVPVYQAISGLTLGN